MLGGHNRVQSICPTGRKSKFGCYVTRYTLKTQDDRDEVIGSPRHRPPRCSPLQSDSFLAGPYSNSRAISTVTCPYTSVPRLEIGRDLCIKDANFVGNRSSLLSTGCGSESGRRCRCIAHMVIAHGGQKYEAWYLIHERVDYSNRLFQSDKSMERGRLPVVVSGRVYLSELDH